MNAKHGTALLLAAGLVVVGLTAAGFALGILAGAVIPLAALGSAYVFVAVASLAVLGGRDVPLVLLVVAAAIVPAVGTVATVAVSSASGVALLQVVLMTLVLGGATFGFPVALAMHSRNRWLAGLPVLLTGGLAVVVSFLDTSPAAAFEAAGLVVGVFVLALAPPFYIGQQASRCRTGRVPSETPLVAALLVPLGLLLAGTGTSLLQRPELADATWMRVVAVAELVAVLGLAAVLSNRLARPGSEV